VGRSLLRCQCYFIAFLDLELVKTNKVSVKARDAFQKLYLVVMKMLGQMQNGY
jgi:hypothetical protein